MRPVDFGGHVRIKRFQPSQRSSSKEAGGNGGYKPVPLQHSMPSTGLQIALGSETSDLSDVGTQEAEGVCASVGIGSWTKKKKRKCVTYTFFSL